MSSPAPEVLPPPGSVTARIGLRTAAVIFLVTSGMGVLLAGQGVLATSSFGRPMPWSMALANGLIEMWLWGLLIPFVFALAHWSPFTRGTWVRSLAMHVLAALAVTLVFATMRTVIVDELLPESLRPSSFFRPPPPPSPSLLPASGEALRVPLATPSFWDRITHFTTPRLYLLILTYGLLVGIAHWLAQLQRFRARESQARELSRQLAEARLQALRMQLNPHFLFNTLNAISTLVHRDPHAADEMIACLSDFLRLTLSGSAKPEATLGTELEFARRYLDIEKVRFGDHLVIEEAIEPACLGALVPTLILQPLLENAVRHGIEPEEKRGTIRLAARRSGTELLLLVADTGTAATRVSATTRPIPSPQLGRSPGPGGTGVGLANTRSRLRELYGEAAQIVLRPSDTGGTEVEIRLPWHEAPLPESLASITAIVSAGSTLAAAEAGNARSLSEGRSLPPRSPGASSGGPALRPG